MSGLREKGVASEARGRADWERGEGRWGGRKRCRERREGEKR